MTIEIGKVYKHYLVLGQEFNKHGGRGHENDKFWRCQCIKCNYIREGEEAIRFDYLNPNDKHSVSCPNCKTKYTIANLPEVKVGASYNDCTIIHRTFISVPKRGEIYILKDNKTKQEFPRYDFDLRKGYKWHPPTTIKVSQSKLSKECRQLLDKNKILHKSEMTFFDLRGENNSALYFDDYCPEYNLIIEYDGTQHYKSSNGIFKNKLPSIMTRDKIKEQWCIDHEMNLIRIPWYQEGKVTIDDLRPYISNFHIIKNYRCY